MMRRYFIPILLTFLISGCGIFKPEPTITPMIPVEALSTPYQPGNFTFNDCPMEVPEDMPSEQLPDLKCATLTVPENRQKLGSPEIEIAVAIVKTDADNPKTDPVLVLLGNPGYGIAMAYVLQFFLNDVMADRDIILLDQRGTGYSKPSYNCEEIGALSYIETTSQSQIEYFEQYVEATKSCVNKIKSPGVDLSAYTTSAVAADLEDLRQALEIKQWNIFSLFDGSQVALTMMRDYPQGIRSVIMDSAVPLHINQAVDLGKNATLTFDRIFQRCNEDEQCNKAFPALKQTFNELLEQLDQQPLQVSVSERFGGTQSKVILDSERLISLVLGLLTNIGDRESIPEIPRMIYQLIDENTNVASDLLGRSGDVFPKTAMDDWMSCNEEFSFITLEQVDQANAVLDTPFREYFNTQVEGQINVCDQWDAPGVPKIENQPVGSSVPTLIFSGEFDWSQPPSWAEETATTLRNSTVVEFSGTGQGVYISGNWNECTHSLVETFLESPDTRLDTSCSSLSSDILWITLP